MLRRTDAAALLLLLPLGCATVDASQGTYKGADAGAPADAPTVTMDAPDAADAPDAVADAGFDVPTEDIIDVPVDQGAADLGSGTCADGGTRPCYTGLPATRSVGLCGDGFQRCVAGRWGVECNGENLPAVEVCNHVDDDCDGTVDNIASSTCYTGPPGTAGVGICQRGVTGCEGTTTSHCVGQVVPNTHELCGNGLDDNCNGTTDEGCP